MSYNVKQGITVKKKKEKKLNPLSKIFYTSGSYDFTYKFNQIFKKGAIRILHNFFHRKGTLLNLYYEANVTMKSKFDKDDTKR